MYFLFIYLFFNFISFHFIFWLLVEWSEGTFNLRELGFEYFW